MNGEKQKAEIGKAESANEFRHLTQRPHPQPLSQPMGEGGVGLCLTRFELAALLKVSVRTVDRMIAAEQLPVRRVRGHVRFLRSDVERYLQGNVTSDA
jgi:excisionase family DNA binding protein